MKTIALLPVRNEASMVPFSLAYLSAFCDVILVNDQYSDDSSRDVCLEFLTRVIRSFGRQSRLV